MRTPVTWPMRLIAALLLVLAALPVTARAQENATAASPNGRTVLETGVTGEGRPWYRLSRGIGRARQP